MVEEVFENGYPYSDPLPKWIDEVVHMVQKEDLGGLIIVDGPVGYGKSSAAAQMLRQIDPGFVATEESFKLRYLLGADSFKNNLITAEEQGCKGLIFDEVGVDFNNRSVMSKPSTQIFAILQMNRALKMVVIFVLPSIKFIDSGAFDLGLIRFIIHVHDKKQGQYSRFKAYDPEKTASLRQRLDPKKKIYIRKAYIQSFCNFDGQIKPLPPDYQEMLDRIGIQNKKDRIKEFQTPQGYTIAEASGNLGVTTERVIRATKKHGILTVPDPRDGRKKVIPIDEYERLRTLAFGGEEAL